MTIPAGPASSIAVHDTPQPRTIREYLSWPAIFAGNAITGGFILVLLPLGVAAGLSMASPYAGQGASGSRIGALAIFWLAFVYLFSVAAGGYVAGRLRPRANDANSEEASFRDGMNGFVFWGVGMILSAIFTFMTVASAVGTVTRAAGQAVGGIANGAGTVASAAMPSGGAGMNISTDYLADLFLRTTSNTPQPQQQNSSRSEEDVRAEIARILTRSAASGQVDDADKTYLAQLVAQRTGLAENDARARVDETLKRATDVRNRAIEQAKAAADEARKVSVQAAFWTAIASLLTGLAAWYAAQLGGRHRDENRY